MSLRGKPQSREKSQYPTKSIMEIQISSLGTGGIQASKYVTLEINNYYQNKTTNKTESTLTSKRKADKT